MVSTLLFHVDIMLLRRCAEVVASSSDFWLLNREENKPFLRKVISGFRKAIATGELYLANPEKGNIADQSGPVIHELLNAELITVGKPRKLSYTDYFPV
jgi:hypothetical protein